MQCKRLLHIIGLGCLILVASCRKFTDVGTPRTQLTGATVFTSDGTAIAAMTGIYSKMMGTSSSFMNTQVSLLPGLSADELTNYSTNTSQGEFYSNALSTTNFNIMLLWRDIYVYLFQVNAVIEGLTGSTGLTAGVKSQLEGEARFFRALCYFHLVNLFGDVPYVVTTDYRTNALVARAHVSDIYQKIISDLKDAQGLLPGSYSTVERVRPVKWAATALLARTYLYTGDWVNAEAAATSVINNSAAYNLVKNPDSVFLKNSNEAIWQLMPVVPGINTYEGNVFILTGMPTSVAISNALLNAFEPGDVRKTSWTKSITIGTSTYYYPYKYKIKAGTPVTEYSMVLRLAEQYLIRAEARAQQNNISGAVADLNILRSRAKLADLPVSLSKSQSLAAVEQERRVELFTESGHRWMDLKRTGRADVVFGPIKPGWKPTAVLYPVPQSELQNNPNMTQNAGYF